MNEHPRHLVIPAETRCNSDQISLISRSNVFPVKLQVIVCSTLFSAGGSEINHPPALLYISVHGFVCVTPVVRAQFKAYRHGTEKERQRETERKREMTYVMIAKRMKRERVKEERESLGSGGPRD